jgi:hypothetical protein
MSTPDSKLTPNGSQLLIPGVKPLTMRDRLELLWQLPKLPAKRQKPCDDGLFDLAARNQLELF